MNGITKELSAKIEDLRKDIIDIEANIEVNIDYPEYEEGIDFTNKTIKPHIERLLNKINEILSNSNSGKLIKDGINVSLLGKPNVGKSSILNTLLNEEKAIVTNIPGTTRDIVEGRINLNGIILNLIDTAGIRDTNDVVEKIGVEKSLKMIEESDLIIYVINNNEEIDAEDITTINKFKNKKSIIFINKNDLETKINKEKLKDLNIVYGNTIDIDGLDNLKQEIIKMFNLNQIEKSDYTFLSNARQISLIKKCKETLENILLNIDNLPVDVFTIDLNEAYELLGEIIGATYKEDLLDELFSKFCLGK